MNRDIRNIASWEEPIKKLYRFEITKDLAYEIHVLNFRYEEDTFHAKASLYIVGNRSDIYGNLKFCRECLTNEKTLEECITAAYEDYERNVDWEYK